MNKINEQEIPGVTLNRDGAHTVYILKPDLVGLRCSAKNQSFLSSPINLPEVNNRTVKLGELFVIFQFHLGIVTIIWMW